MADLISAPIVNHDITTVQQESPKQQIENTTKAPEAESVDAAVEPVEKKQEIWTKHENSPTKATTNEIRVRSDGQVSLYAGYGQKVIRDAGMVVVRATGRPIQIAVSTVEALKSRVPGVHQITKTGTVVLEDSFTNEQGDVRVVKKNVPFVEITLTTNPSEDQIKDSGYQTPLSDEERKVMRANQTARRNLRVNKRKELEKNNQNSEAKAKNTEKNAEKNAAPSDPNSADENAKNNENAHQNKTENPTTTEPEKNVVEPNLPQEK